MLPRNSVCPWQGPRLTNPQTIPAEFRQSTWPYPARHMGWGLRSLDPEEEEIALWGGPLGPEAHLFWVSELNGCLLRIRKRTRRECSLEPFSFTSSGSWLQTVPTHLTVSWAISARAEQRGWGLLCDLSWIFIPQGWAMYSVPGLRRLLGELQNPRSHVGPMGQILLDQEGEESQELLWLYSGSVELLLWCDSLSCVPFVPWSHFPGKLFRGLISATCSHSLHLMCSAQGPGSLCYCVLS